MKNSVVFAVVAAASSAAFAVAPTIRESSVTFDQSLNRLVTIKYVLDDAPGIVTLDIETNRTGAATNNDADWVSIGGENIQTLSPAESVNRLVTNLTSHTILWRARNDWPDQRIRNDAIRAKVTVWSTNTPPNYLVVDLTGEESPAYYTDAAFLPNGGLANNCYRERYMVMRKIPAAGVEWTMGSPATETYHNNEALHRVVLTNDYYIGVFPVTYGQYANSPASKATYGGTIYEYGHKYADTYTNGCPRTMCDWQGVARGNAANGGIQWPEYRHRVATGSFIGNLRAQTGIDFDLPTEAQWEFACRAGCGATMYHRNTFFTGGQSVEMRDAAKEVAWCTVNSTNGFHVVGQKLPNAWGLYDMLGNINEQCLDWYGTYTNGVDTVYYEPEGPSSAADGKTASDGTSKRVYRGGRFYSEYQEMRCAQRINGSQSGQYDGARLMCPVTLKFPDGEK